IKFFVAGHFPIIRGKINSASTPQKNTGPVDLGASRSTSRYRLDSAGQYRREAQAPPDSTSWNSLKQSEGRNEGIWPGLLKVRTWGTIIHCRRRPTRSVKTVNAMFSTVAATFAAPTIIQAAQENPALQT